MEVWTSGAVCPMPLAVLLVGMKPDSIVMDDGRKKGSIKCKEIVAEMVEKNRRVVHDKSVQVLQHPET